MEQESQMRFRPGIKLSLTVVGMWICSVAGANAQTSQPAERIAYDSCYVVDYYDVECDIVVLADGSQTVVAARGVQPKWSPDGTRIAFIGQTSGEILVANIADPSALTNVTNYPGANGWPSWSSDGNRIAFASSRTGSLQLYIANADGTGLVRVTNEPGFGGQYAWSPDGRTIALMLVVNGDSNLFTMNADGSNRRQLTVGGDVGNNLSWSSDSGRIIFDCAAEVCAINADGSGVVALTSGSAAHGVLSPVGGSLAFQTARFGNGLSEIAVQRSDGAIVRVAPDTEGFGPVWSPDGERLLFQGTETVAYSGICYFGPGAHNADDYCVPLTGIYVANVDGTHFELFAVGNDPDWYMPRAGQPLASFSPTCSGSSCVFDASGSLDPEGNIVSYRWLFGDGTSATGATPSHTYATGGYYTVTLTIVDGQGLQSTASRRVAANAAPVASFTLVCTGPTCKFNGSASVDPDGTLVSFEWRFGDGATSLGRTATHSYASGTFVAQLTVRDNAGDSSTSSQTLQIVNALPVPSFTAACYGFMCTFDASASVDPDGTIQSFLWHFGDDWALYSPALTTHMYWAAGTYAVSLTVTDNAGQQGTRNQTINVVPVMMHVGDLDAFNERIDAKLRNGGATVTVHDVNHAPVADATVTGLFSWGGSGSCTTDATGQCKLGVLVPASTLTRASMTIQSVTRLGFVYQPTANHDPDGDSNGTTIAIVKR